MLALVLASPWFTRTFACACVCVVRVNQPIVSVLLCNFQVIRLEEELKKERNLRSDAEVSSACKLLSYMRSAVYCHSSVW